MNFTKSDGMQTPIKKEYYVLGTVIRLQVNENGAEDSIKEAVAKLYEIDDKMSVFKDDSEISNINKNAGESFQRVSSDTYFVMEKSIYYSNLSQGAFDATIRPIVDLWGFGRGHSGIPEEAEIQEKLRLVNYKDIILNGEDISIRLNNKNQSIDAGGIAKGYAADEVKNIFLKNGIKSAIINLGGNIYALGKKGDGSMWNIGIQDPLGRRGEYAGIVSVENKSVVTSGNYERFFVNAGKRFHHIIDPRTGYPCENGVISATIISDASIDGDAMSTCAYIMGVEKGIEFIEGIEGAEAVLITEDRKIYATSGISENFKLFNKEYIYESNVN